MKAGVNVRYLELPQLRLKAEILAGSLKLEKSGHLRATQKAQNKEGALKSAKILVKEMRKQQQNTNELAKLVQKAADQGLLDDNSALQAFLVDCFRAVIDGRRSRVLSGASKEFYMIIMQNCGQMLHDYVSRLFSGPSASTTRAWKAAVDYPFMLGLHSDFFDAAAHLIGIWGMTEMPFLLAEDGSALQMRIDVTTKDGKAQVFGLCGNNFVVDTVDQFREAARSRPVATTLYAYTLVPLVDGAPSIPCFAFGHDNSSSTFNTQLAKSIWEYTWQEFQSRGIKLVGHTHDGDRRLVNLGHELCRLAPIENAAQQTLPTTISCAPPPTSLVPRRPAPITLDHAIITYQIFYQNAGPCSFIPIMDIIDWLHTGWRIKNQLLQPTRRLDLGGLLISPSYLYKNKELLGLSDADLDPSNKQDMRGMEKVFDFYREVSRAKMKHSLEPEMSSDGLEGAKSTSEHSSNVKQALRKRPYLMMETDNIRKALLSSPADNYGLYLFIEFGHRYLRMFLLKDRQPIDIIKDAAFCIMFIGFWRRDIDLRAAEADKDAAVGAKSARYDSNCLTPQTCHDIVFTCTLLILSTKMFKEHFPRVKIDFSKFSSRFSEYFFQTLRSCTKTSNKVNAAQYAHIVKGVVVSLMHGGQQNMKTTSANSMSLPVLQSKRGMPKSQLCIDEDWNNAPADYWPDDMSISEAIDVSFNEIQCLFSKELSSSERCYGSFNMWTQKRSVPAKSKMRAAAAKRGKKASSRTSSALSAHDQLGMEKSELKEKLQPYLLGIKADVQFLPSLSLEVERRNKPANMPSDGNTNESVATGGRIGNPINRFFGSLPQPRDRSNQEQEQVTTDDEELRPLYIRPTTLDEAGYSMTHETDFEELPPDAPVPSLDILSNVFDDDSGDDSNPLEPLERNKDSPMECHDTAAGSSAGTVGTGSSEAEPVIALKKHLGERITNSERVKVKVAEAMAKISRNAVDVDGDGPFKSLVKTLRQLAYHFNSSMADQQAGRAERFSQIRGIRPKGKSNLAA
ncbi:hypothetical protein CEUSTIGMA_g12295.t1 [Chlamydomonas eustigma]|uniref:Uncharacterized protein n=1 Tax=Chlamydomonas eustigma TaxID=1157962 RepID=A0A250XP61_9CHLO|nr:hypothetical protein CEUSTIGMA_g12295.t1 [Chlamydomonas eustigma]|eukprot:GAX84874.1 hypothetical protein CEUSTIGMA_g12295.t1 [Chlamydomonas eustigma]